MSVDLCALLREKKLISIVRGASYLFSGSKMKTAKPPAATGTL